VRIGLRASPVIANDDQNKAAPARPARQQPQNRASRSQTIPRLPPSRHCPITALTLHSPSTVSAAVKSNEVYPPRHTPRYWAFSVTRLINAIR
jgi:hypothetical protein